MGGSSGGGAAPSGWTQIYDETDDYISIYEKIATGTESAGTVNFTQDASGRWACQVIKITGSHPTEASQVGGAANNVASSSVDPGSLTPSGGAKDWLWIAVDCHGHILQTSRTISTYPTNYTGITPAQNSAGGIGQSYVGSAYRQLNASSEDPGAFTLTGNIQFWYAVTIAVPPSDQVSPSAIATAEAFGTAKLNQTIVSAGIATAYASGTISVVPIIAASGIATAEAFTDPTVNLGDNQTIVGHAIDTAEAFGTTVVAGPITATGIATAYASGTAVVAGPITVGGIATAYASGTAVVTLGQQTIRPSGLATTEAFGSFIVRQRLPVRSPLPAPNAEQIANALSGRYGPTRFNFRYHRHSRDGAFLGDISNAVTKPGSITLDNRRAVVRTLDITLDLDALPSDFSISTDIIAVYIEVYVQPSEQWVAIPVGRFILDVSETHYFGDSVHLECDGSDVCMSLVRSTRTAPFTVASGANIVSTVNSILETHGFPYSIPAATYTAPQSFTWGPGASDYQIARDLLIGINYYPLWADASGTIRSRPRIDPATEDAAVTYQDTAEPRMISGDSDYVKSQDPKLPNRVVVIIDDPRNSDYGYVQRENVDDDAPNSTQALVYGTESTIVTSSVNNPSVVTTAAAHGLQTEVTALIKDHSGSTPAIDGSHIITKVSDTAVSIPINVTVGGTDGTLQATTVQLLVLNGDSDPPTKCVIDDTVSASIAEFELQWAAMLSRTAELPTLLDPRREAHEWYTLDIDGVEDSTLWGVIEWELKLEPGAEMKHRIGLAESIDIVTPPKV